MFKTFNIWDPTARHCPPAETSRLKHRLCASEQAQQLVFSQSYWIETQLEHLIKDLCTYAVLEEPHLFVC